RGNLIQTKAGDKIFNDYSYDETNRLVEVINKHKDITSYIYDGFGNRVAQYIDLETNAGGNRPGKGKGHAYGHDKDKHGKGKAIGHGKDNNGNPHPGWGHQYKRDSMEIKYVVDITKPYDNVLMMYGDHYQVQRYTRGIDTISVDQWELEDPNNGWIPDTTGTNLEGEPDRLYYLQDEMGSITKVIGEDGKTSAHYNYDEFGRPLSFKKFDQNWPGPDNTFGYTGYQYDVYAGLWYAQARYYMPETGRFISEDPWPGDMTDPQTLNPYPYVVNNPLKYVDPLGLWPAEFENDELSNRTRKIIEGNSDNNWNNCPQGTDRDGFDYEWTGKYVTPEFKVKVLEICEKLQMDPDDLMGIMAFESNGINPSCVNKVSGATGLIQFMPSTARGLGTTTEALAKMSAVEQLDYVYKYYEGYAGKIHNIQDAYMVVFMPIAVGKDDDYKLGIKGSKAELAKGLSYGVVYKQNAGLDINKDGIITKGEAAQKVIDTRNRYSKID
ncbi:RHS repeat-associated core domain-containing protein, partial [Lutispora sp.]|uniref:RHS repeat-associated core domain-containing protein n=1 Tax=Lutispora sp. TaxID=2828727 RepID=UPI0035655FAE